MLPGSLFLMLKLMFSIMKVQYSIMKFSNLNRQSTEITPCQMMPHDWYHLLFNTGA
jgi:hypothetical protein